jgi:predicted secreted protein
MGTVRLGYANRETTAEVGVGETIEVVLPENATTGYQWRLASYPEDTLILADTAGTGSPPGRLGAGGGTSVFRFRATSPGQGVLTFTLTRGAASSATEFEFTARVRVTG